MIDASFQSRIVLPLAAVGLVFILNQRVESQPTPITVATVSWNIPTEVVDGAGAPIDPSASTPGPPFQFFDDYSWRAFIALNWPATGTIRGEADIHKTMADSQTPRVWETWKADYEAFQPAGAPPTEWTSYDAATPCLEIPYHDGGRTRLLAPFSKFGNLAEADSGAPGNPLVAQNHTYTRYEVRTNRAEFDFIRDNRLYERATIQGLHQPLRFTPGSIEVKASWRELHDDEVDAARNKYYVINAKLQNPVNNDQCEDHFMALVGLHIVQKTPLRPQWVWSTFEHVDNVPEFGVAPTQPSYSYNDPHAPQTLNPPTEPPPLTHANPPVPNPTPMQVVQLADMQQSTKNTNQLYRVALAGTVWSNYKLAMTQWPTVTSDPSKPFPEDISGSPFPTDSSVSSVANTVMETYHQLDGNSCMNCHDTARSGHTDFVWFVQLRAQPPDPSLFAKLNKMLIAKSQKSKFTATTTIIGKNGPHQWATSSDSSKDHIDGTKIGDPASRLTIPVSDGDIVSFVVESGPHHVLFERAKTEIAQGVWEVVPGSGTLDPLPNGTLTNFDHDEARFSTAGTSQLIKIRILHLPRGKSILFACNPHSTRKTNVEMVGALLGR